MKIAVSADKHFEASNQIFQWDVNVTFIAKNEASNNKTVTTYFHKTRKVFGTQTKIPSSRQS